jgi:hypothetical protein
MLYQIAFIGVNKLDYEPLAKVIISILKRKGIHHKGTES